VAIPRGTTILLSILQIFRDRERPYICMHVEMLSVCTFGCDRADVFIYCIPVLLFQPEHTRVRSSPGRPVNRSKALPHNLSYNNISNKSSPNTPRFGDSLLSFASLRSDELPDVDSEQGATTAKLKLVIEH